MKNFNDTIKTLKENASVFIHDKTPFLNPYLYYTKKNFKSQLRLVCP